MIAKRTSAIRTSTAALLAVLGLAGTARANVQARSTVLPPQQDTMSVPHADNVRLSRIEVPSGTTIRARMDSSVSTRRSPVGTPFLASTVTPVLDSSGNVILPTGTEVLGRVQGSHKGGILFRGSRLAIGVEAMKIDGRFVPVTASMTSQPVDHYRAPLLLRKQARIAQGTVFQAQLQAPVTVGVTREVVPQPPHATGGGPIHHPRATGGGPAAATQPATVPCPVHP